MQKGRMEETEPGMLDLLGSDFELSSELPGAPSTQVFRLRALSPGEIVLSFSYGRP